MRIDALANRYRHDLLQDTVPFWPRHGADTEYGGCITSLDRDGSIIDSDKSV